MPYTVFNRLIHQIAATESGARFWSRVLYRVDGLGLRLSGHRVIVSAVLSGLPVVMLTSIGAKSGQPRTVPLVAIMDEDHSLDHFALIASNWGQPRYPAWYFNLKANPKAQCRVRGQVAMYVAQEVDSQSENYARIWARAQQVYFGFALYRQRLEDVRAVPIMLMQPYRP